MAHVVSFRTARFDAAAETPNPINPIAGESVLTWLRAELAKAGYATTEPSAEDWGWYMDVKRDADAYLVGASADPDGTAASLEWFVQVHKHRSLKDKLLGRNKMTVDDPLSALIERVVRADSQIEDVHVDREAQ